MRTIWPRDKNDGQMGPTLGETTNYVCLLCVTIMVMVFQTSDGIDVAIREMTKLKSQR